MKRRGQVILVLVADNIVEEKHSKVLFGDIKGVITNEQANVYF